MPKTHVFSPFHPRTRAARDVLGPLAHRPPNLTIGLAFADKSEGLGVGRGLSNLVCCFFGSFSRIVWPNG